jgi:putative ABC transport system ATP-binding protein
VVVVTHEPAVAVWAERIVVLKDGRTLTEFKTSDFGDAHRLAAHYQDVVGAAPVATEGAR